MPRDTLTGSRIRERRVTIGMRQAELARRADISASYLNLIEHNRRRIGGKLLLDIADALGVEPSLLTEGAEAALIATLREVAHENRAVRAELDRLDEFAGRFPGWAALLATTAKRIATLERTVVTLTDRLTHDPHLAASLHDMLTTVTAIRSTASILADSDEIEPEWQDRFHRNINDDSARLAEISRDLVGYLDTAENAGADFRAPQEEVDAVLGRHKYHFADLEEGRATPAEIVAAEGAGLSAAARSMLLEMLDRLAQDARAVPQAQVAEALATRRPDPFDLAGLWGTDPGTAMRRIATLSDSLGAGPVALAICDASGALVFRQPLDSFPFPRFGTGCPLLPLYQSLSRPMLPIAMPVEPPIRVPGSFDAFAFAQPVGPMVPNRVPLLQAHMLVVPVERAGDRGAEAGLPVGVSCRICPRPLCAARSEPSILLGGL